MINNIIITQIMILVIKAIIFSVIGVYTSYVMLKVLNYANHNACNT